MHGSPKLTENLREFLRESKELVEEWKKRYGTLGNYIHDKNTKHIRWLKYMGFTINELNRCTSERGERFILFYV
jgi:hypothetical protein